MFSLIVLRYSIKYFIEVILIFTFELLKYHRNVYTNSSHTERCKWSFVGVSFFKVLYILQMSYGAQITLKNGFGFSGFP